VANHLPNDRLPWAQTARLQHWKPPLVSLQSSFRMYCKQPNLNLYTWESTNLHTQYPRGQDRVIQRTHNHTTRAEPPTCKSSIQNGTTLYLTWCGAPQHRPDGVRPFIDLWYRELLLPVQVTDAKKKKRGSRKLYLVHIRAQISLYQINANKCTHIWLNHNFINTFRTPTCFNP